MEKRLKSEADIRSNAERLLKEEKRRRKEEEENARCAAAAIAESSRLLSHFFIKSVLRVEEKFLAVSIATFRDNKTSAVRHFSVCS